MNVALSDLDAFDTARLSRALEVLVNERTGIIRWLEEFPRDPGAPPFFHVYADAALTDALGAPRNSTFGGGASISRFGAVAKAMGEALERYCAALVDDSALRLAAYDTADFPCVDPERFARYTQEQCATPSFPFQPFGRGTQVRWIAAYDALSRERAFVPAGMVYVPYATVPGEASIVQSITTGLACHTSFARAALSAVCEVVERDAFTLAWQARWSPPRIELASLPRDCRELVERLAQPGDEVILLNATTDLGIPVVVSVLSSDNIDAPARVVAAAAAAQPEVAVRKSLEELAHSRRAAQPMARQQRADALLSHDDVLSNHDHVALHCAHRNRHLGEFLVAATERVSFQELPVIDGGNAERMLEEVCGRLAVAGHRAWLVDLTSPDVASLGFHVVRAIVPGLHPLALGHALRVRGGERLRKALERAGNGEENHVPHPFP